jgi:hypothetical protein
VPCDVTDINHLKKRAPRVYSNLVPRHVGLYTHCQAYNICQLMAYLKGSTASVLCSVNSAFARFKNSSCQRHRHSGYTHTHTDLMVNADAWYCNFFEEMRRHYCARRQTYYARLEFRATNCLLKMFGRLPNFVVEEYAAVCNPAM